MNRRNAEKLLQYYRRGRCSSSSSVATKESQPSGVIKQIGEGILKLLYTGTAGGVGYVLGGLLISSEEPRIEKLKESAAQLLKHADKEEMRADKRREDYLYLSKPI